MRIDIAIIWEYVVSKVIHLFVRKKRFPYLTIQIILMKN